MSSILETMKSDKDSQEIYVRKASNLIHIQRVDQE